MFTPRYTKRIRERRAKRYKMLLLMVACLLAVLTADEQKCLRGRFCGVKNIKRTRKEISSLFHEMGYYQERAYRMNVDQFTELHGKLSDELNDVFPTQRKRGKTVNGSIDTKLRLSAAIRYFSGGSPLDIMLSHGLSRQSVYNSVWGVVDSVNNTPGLCFNTDGAEFPSHEEQEDIARGFHGMSRAGFDKICMAVDGMLVWTIQPSAADCMELGIGERQFHCYRKDKYGMVLMAGCDHLCRFRWADIKHPGLASDYLAFSTSDLGLKLEKPNNNIMKPGYTMVGDNAWVPTEWMATPVPGAFISRTDDAYNFFQSQIRITIERAFGIFVHRWGILRRPLSMSILKVPALVICLMRLHNFCIDSKSRCTEETFVADERYIRRVAANRGLNNATAVQLDRRGIPVELIGGGHHFRDIPRQRRPEVLRQSEGMIPMEVMRRQVALSGLKRPEVNKYSGSKRKRYEE